MDWRDLGVGDDGLPIHIAFPVTAGGQRPALEADAHHWECWCVDQQCLLTLALKLAWRAGLNRADQLVVDYMNEAGTGLPMHMAADLSQLFTERA